jgi:hypothetical protein
VRLSSKTTNYFLPILWISMARQVMLQNFVS